MSAVAAGPSSAAAPPPPPRPQQPSSAPTSHARFLLSQVLTSLEHLHTSGCLDALTHREVSSRLNRAVLKEDHPLASSIDTLSEEDSAEDALGKRNAWVRKTMSETDLLPNVVETALGLVGSPFLGDTQIDAIVKLVEMSQENIAHAVTSPRNQRVASSGAFAGLKGVGTGVGRGVAVAGERIATKREESRIKREERKEEKKKQREIKDELKRERELIKQKQLASGQATPSVAEQGFDPSEDEDEDSEMEQQSSTPVPSSQGPSSLTAGSSPQATVAYAQVGKASSSATTTFIPWPGVIISSTLVASPAGSDVHAASAQSQIKPEDEDRLRARKPPPLPSAGNSNQTQLPLQPGPGSSTPAAQPPPMHHARSTLSQTSRPLDEIGEPVGSKSGSGTIAPQQSARQPASTISHLEDKADDQGGLVDVTDSKRRNWKSRLLG